MEGSVKFIFKTLVKVPAIIIVCYIFFNIFSFVLSYFKLVSASYTIMQVGMENNYIPSRQEQSIKNYLSTLNTGVLSNVRIAGERTYNVRRQYGEELEVGVSARIKFIWPLMHHEQFEASSDPDQAFGKMLSRSELAAKRNDKEVKQNIVITYKISGLQYYPDLD